jgi:hypothetical protein
MSGATALTQNAADVQTLTAMLGTVPWVWDVLAVVGSLPIPAGVFVAAGTVRNTIWDILSGVRPEAPTADIDVVYHDVHCRQERRWASVLRQQHPEYTWEVTNQAWVHEWYRDKGRLIDPYPTLSHALEMWPETATAVAVRLRTDSELEVVAPFGLRDLFGLVARYNPRQATRTEFLARVEGKRWQRKWPELTIIDSEMG